MWNNNHKSILSLWGSHFVRMFLYVYHPCRSGRPVVEKRCQLNQHFAWWTWNLQYRNDISKLYLKILLFVLFPLLPCVNADFTIATWTIIKHIINMLHMLCITWFRIGNESQKPTSSKLFRLPCHYKYSRYGFFWTEATPLFHSFSKVHHGWSSCSSWIIYIYIHIV